MIIGQGLVHMDPVKLSAIKEWHPPSFVKGVCSFLGFTNFYRKFIPNYSNMVIQHHSPYSKGPHLVLGHSSAEGLQLLVFYLLVSTCPVYS